MSKTLLFAFAFWLLQRFRYLFIVDQPTSNCLPFPDVEDDWTPSCRLIQPTNGILPADQLIDFTVQLDEPADSVVISDGKLGTMSSLKHEGNNKWTGQCPPILADRFVTLVAQKGTLRKDLLTFGVRLTILDICRTFGDY